MTYKCILLKDLPDFDAGTEFYIKKLDSRDDEYYCKFPNENSYLKYNYQIPKEVIDNPIWVKKELDENCLTELKCSCGNTNLFIEPREEPSEWDDDIRYFYMSIYSICPKCGRENHIIKFKTHYSFR